MRGRPTPKNGVLIPQSKVVVSPSQNDGKKSKSKKFSMEDYLEFVELFATYEKKAVDIALEIARMDYAETIPFLEKTFRFSFRKNTILVYIGSVTGSPYDGLEISFPSSYLWDDDWRLSFRRDRRASES